MALVFPQAAEDKSEAVSADAIRLRQARDRKRSVHAGPAAGPGRWLGAEQGADDSGAMLGVASEGRLVRLDSVVMRDFQSTSAVWNEMLFNPVPMRMSYHRDGAERPELRPAGDKIDVVCTGCL